MLEEVLELHKQGKLDEAEQRYRELLTFNPDDPETLHLLGMVRRQKGDFREAMQLVQRAIELSPERANYYGTLAGMEFHARLFERAREHFEKAIELNPNFTGAYAALGQIAMLDGNRERAEDNFKLALKANPEQPQVLNSYGNLFLARGDTNQALKYISQAAELAPTDHAILASLGRAHLKLGHYAFAEAGLKKVLEMRPDFHAARLMLSESQMRQQRMREARETLKPLVQFEDQIAPVLAALGDISRAENDLATAISHYRDSLQRQRKQPNVIEAMAWCLRQRGMRREAVGAYREYLQHAPDDAAARRALIGLYLELGLPDEAVQELDRALAATPRDVELLALKATALELADRLDEAETCARDALARREDSLGPRLVLTRAALRRNDATGALELLQPLSGAPLSPMQRRFVATLRGHAYDRSGGPRAAVTQWLAAHAEFENARAKPVTDPVPAELAALLAEARKAQPAANHKPAALLLGAPGSGVEHVAALLADSPALVVPSDRFGPNARHDSLGAPDYQRTLLGRQDEDTRLFVRHYEKPLSRLDLPQGRALVEWLPHFDARLLPALQRAFGTLPLIVATRPRDAALLDWLAFGGAHGYRIDELEHDAQWLERARAHLDAAVRESAWPVLQVDAAALERDPGAVVAGIARLLGIPPWAPGPTYERSRRALGGLRASLAGDGEAAYAGILGDAFSAPAG